MDNVESPSEELREALLDLEDARSREAQQRRTAETLLAGLRVLVFSRDPRELFFRLFEVMSEALDYTSAFVLTLGPDGTLTTLASSDARFASTVWKPGPMFQRVIAGQPTTVFDTEQTEEWRRQPASVRSAVRSAIHFAVHTPERQAVFVGTHPDRGHFSRDHLELARRFSVLATQALQKQESESRLADLEEKLATEALFADLNRKLMESEKRLSRAKKMEALGLLAGGVAHDLNNILSGISGYPELILMDEDLAPRHRKALELIHEAGWRAAAVVADLLTVARGVASVKEPVNLNRVVREYLISPEYEQLMKVHPGVDVRTDLDPDLYNIRASRVHIQKVLMNLVANAAEAIPEGVAGRMVVATEDKRLDQPLNGYQDICAGEYAVLSVTDNGTGIPGEDLERIFEPFYARKVMGRSGTGLGLTVVWNTVRDHGGYLDVESGESGTRFTLYFPRILEEEESEDEDVPLASVLGHGERILVVDDLEGQRRIACSMLERLGYTAESVTSGEEALVYLRTHDVDLVVLDMIMEPGLNGRKTYEKIVKFKPDQKAVITSGYSETEEVRAAQGLGAMHYLRKPYSLREIGQAVQAALVGPEYRSSR